MKQGSFRLGCDIGGTFTDFVLLNDNTGSFEIFKCLTTHQNPSEAIETGINFLKEKVPGFQKHVTDFIHGTTLVINAIIERKGSKTALITTKGFKDVLELGRELRYDSYDLFPEYPEPLVPRNLRLEVQERINSDGEILLPLNKKEIDPIINEIKQSKIKSVAICLINSYKNGLHELEIKNALRNEFDNLFISTSHEVLPQIREFERTSTTVTNAYVKPITTEYLKQLSSLLFAKGIEKNIFIMLSSGSITTTDIACKFPVRIIESGPTAAVIAAQYYGKMLEIEDIFCFDMGGTTAKSCLIRKGEAGLVSTFEVGRVHRFKKGSGLPIQVPVVDLLEIGAGGGSIARINKMGLLQVGPDSVGSSPGPACYGLGGTEATVTDADLILGYLNPNFFLGGSMSLDLEASQKYIIKNIAKPLGVSLTEAAFGIHDLVNETMATAAKTHIAEKGGNPNIVTITAFGGAGPVHSYGLVNKIRAKNILIPPMAGVGSALGFFSAPIAFDVARSHKMSLKDSTLSEIERIFLELEKQAKNVVNKSNPNKNKIKILRSADMRFIGQGAETNISFPKIELTKLNKKEIRKLFDERYEQLYGRSYNDNFIEFITFKVRAISSNKPFNLVKINLKKLKSNPIKGSRIAYSIIQKKYINFSVFDRLKIKANSKIPGPAIIEEKESTTVIGENMSATIDEYGFIWINFDR